MSKQYAGLSRIGYSDTKTGTITWLQGKASPDTTFNAEATETETTTGAIYGGSSVNAEVRLLTRADYDVLEVFSQEDTEKFWHLEYVDGREYVSRIPINIMIEDDLNTNARDGVSTITMKFVKFHSQQVFELKA